jgi:hypothetical protein
MAGKYLGTVEVVQDVTEIQALKCETRLLDWSDKMHLKRFEASAQYPPLN